ncbi:hemolysin family protein [archaeon]|nr:hemolysin family protein [archaeon]
MLWIEISILVVLILLSGFFSGIETAMISLNQVKVKTLLKQKKRGAETFHRLKSNPHKLIITLLIGNNLVNIGAASFATVVFTQLFGSSGLGIATGIMTFMILVFGEITPKTFAAQNAERISLLVARPIEILSYILLPFVWLFGMISKGMLKLLGSKEDGSLSEEELRTIVTMGRDEGLLGKEAANIMHNVLKFEGTKVVEVMTLKDDIEMVDGEKKLKDVVDFVVKTSYSKYPVYVRSKIVGVLDVDDVLKAMKNKKFNIKIKSLCKKPYFVDSDKEIDDLLSEFEGKQIPMAIVLDGKKLIGLATVEDILEEIVGDIFDKSKRGGLYIRKINEKLIRVDAKVSVAEVNKVLHVGLKSKHFDTIGAFVEHKLKKVPIRGDKIKLRKVILEVDRVTKKHGIKSVQLMKR